jgi:hypothetical protein
VRRHRTLVTVVTLVLGLAAGQAPAAAGGTEITHGQDVARTDQNQLWGGVCDLEADGHSVYAIWDLISPYRTRAEADSFDPGCDRPPRFPVEAFRFRLCERRAGADSCTRWHRV